jgi:hypothetical protein
MTQRDMVRKLLLKHGYSERAICKAYADAERAGLVQRMRNAAGFTPEGYARAVWRDGHKRGSPWIVEFCRRHGIAVNA